MLAYLKSNTANIILLSLAVIISLVSAFYIADIGLLLPIGVLAIASLVIIQISFIKNPKSIVWVIMFYAFTLVAFDREIGHFQFGLLQEGIILLGSLTLIFTASNYDWGRILNDFFIIMALWLVISIYELFNPSGASVQGWLQEVRAAALYPFLVLPIGFLLMKTNKDLDMFIYIVLGFSMLATINGFHQLYIHPWPGEQRFLDDGGAITHILWGKLRVFSFYSDAGQFGASQADISVVALILAFGPFKTWKRIVLFIVSIVSFDGMMISGTRGALFAFVAGLFIGLLLIKNFKALILGVLILGLLLGGLKYTSIGNGIYQIYRLRTALDPQEASFNVRLTNQAALRKYLADKPFGAGLGTMGSVGGDYNKEMFISKIPPDSYWVKVWGMYGVVGLTIWLGFMMYILGKCCGIAWNIEDKGLKIKIVALTGGYAGILFCSYGNEVINTAPSSYFVYISLVFIFISPRLENELKGIKEKQSLNFHQNAI